MALDLTCCEPAQISMAVRDVIVRVQSNGITVNVGDCVHLPTGTDGKATTCVAPAAADIGTVSGAKCSDGWYGIALDSFTSGNSGRVQVQGIVNATTIAAANWGVDACFFPNTSKQLIVSVAATAADANKKIVALSLVTEATDPTVARPRAVLFDGINGFGRCGGAA